jgi:hypothetical protein
MPINIPSLITNTGNDQPLFGTGGGAGGIDSIVSTDNSIGVSGLSIVNLSTAGKAIAPTTVSATGAITAPSLSVTGAVSSATVSATGAVSAGSVVSVGAVSGGTVISNGAIGGVSLALTNSMTSQFNNSAVVVQAGNAAGPVLPLTALNTFLANRDPSRSCFIMLNVSAGTSGVNGNPFCQGFISVPPRNGATGDNGAKIYGAEDQLDLTIQPSGPQFARVMTINVQNLSGVVQDYTYSYTVFGA